MLSSTARRTGATLLVLGGLAVGGVLAAGPALAHVTVNPGEAAQGGFAKLAFRVPNESDTAGTTAVQVSLPTDTPLAFVSVRPVPGWTVEVTRSELPEPVDTGEFTLTEAVTAITWTAEPGTRIEPGQFQEFEVSAGPMPEVDSIAFPADQTYDDGTVVTWAEPVEAAAEEPEHPAPTLSLVEAGDEDGGHSHGGTTDEPTDEPIDEPTETAVAVDAADDEPAAAASSADGDDPTARVLGGAALLVALAALAVNVVALRRRTSA